MAINVTKPSVNLREKLNELETNKGLKGNEILQAETAQEVRSLIGAGRKNLIINGDFQVSQRGDYKTSAVAAVSNAYSIDRWNTWKATVNATHQLQTATINGVLKNTFKITSSNTLTGHIGFNQRIETQDFPIGVNVTVSCWMKSNNSYARLRQNNVADFDSDSPKHSGNGSWEFMSWTLDTTGTLPTASSVNFGAICYESGNVALNVGDYIEVADFQVEVGSVATDFEHRSYGEELALCQRYYQKVSGTFSMIGSRWSTVHFCSYHMPVTMRELPTFLVSTANAFQVFGSNTSAPISTASSVSVAGKDSCELQVTNTNTASSAFIRFTASSDWFSLDAEL